MTDQTLTEQDPIRLGVVHARYRAKALSTKLRAAGIDAWHVLAPDGFAIYVEPNADMDRVNELLGQ